MNPLVSVIELVLCSNNVTLLFRLTIVNSIAPQQNFFSYTVFPQGSDDSGAGTSTEGAAAEGDKGGQQEEGMVHLGLYIGPKLQSCGVVIKKKYKQ